MASGTRIYESGYAFLTDDEGNVMYRKDIETGTKRAKRIAMREIEIRNKRDMGGREE